MDKFDEKARDITKHDLCLSTGEPCPMCTRAIQALRDVYREAREECVKLVRDHADEYIMDDVEVLVDKIRAAKKEMADAALAGSEEPHK